MEAFEINEEKEHAKGIDPYTNTSFLCLWWSFLLVIPVDSFIAFLIWYFLKL